MSVGDDRIDTTIQNFMFRYDGVANITVCATRVPAYNCPSDPNTNTFTFDSQTIGGNTFTCTANNYVVNFGNTITNQTNNCNCFSSGAQRPTVLTNPDLASDKRGISAWFNTAAFAQPGAYTFGNAGIGIVRGPGLINLDFSMLRIFRVGDNEVFRSLRRGMNGREFLVERTDHLFYTV